MSVGMLVGSSMKLDQVLMIIKDKTIPTVYGSARDLFLFYFFFSQTNCKRAIKDIKGIDITKVK